MCEFELCSSDNLKCPIVHGISFYQHFAFLIVADVVLAITYSVLLVTTIATVLAACKVFKGIC